MKSLDVVVQASFGEENLRTDIALKHWAQGFLHVNKLEII